MADKKISELPDGVAPQDTDQFVVDRAATTNVRLGWSELTSAVAGSQINVTAAGNTAGALALVSTGTLTLAGGNNITLSQGGNGITISGANAGGAQTGISSIVVSDTTYTSGQIIISGVGGGITAKSGVGQHVDLSVAAPVAQTVQTQNVVVPAASDQTYTSGTVVFSGGDNVTVGTNGQTILFSAASQSVQPETQTFLSGVGNSQTTYTSGNVNLSVNGGLLTIRSTTGQAFQFSVSQSVQPETQTFIGGISASDTLYTSGSVRFTGVGGGVTVGTNTGQRVDISVAAPVAQTAQTGISGIANSQTTYTSGTVSLSELGAITIRSTTGNQYQFSVNAQSVQPETQTFVGGVGNSQTTYTSGTVNLSVNGGNLTIRSTTGNAFQFSVSQSVQAETQTFLGGIQNSQTTYTSGTVNLSVVAGNLTIRSTTGQALQFSMSQTVQAETQTFLGGLAGSNTTYTSGTVTITGVGGGVTVSSNTGQRIDISVAAPVAQTGTYQSAIAASNTTYTSGLVVFTGSNMVTVKSSGAGQTVIIDATQTNQSAIKALGASNTGNTAGNTGVSTGVDWVLAGSNNITISQSTAGGGPNTLWVSGPSVAGAQTGISGFANSETTYTSGSVTLSALANITIRSTTGQQFQFSVPSGATATGNLNAISNSNTTFTSGTIGLSELGAITIRSTTGNQFQFSVNAQSVQPETQTFVSGIAGSNTTYTSGVITITGVGGGVTVNSNTGQRIDISVAAQSVQPETQTFIAGIQNSETTYSSGSVKLSVNGGLMTIRSTTGQAFQFSISQSVQPETQTFLAGVAGSNTTYTSGTFTITGVGGGVTVSSNTGQRIDISVAAQTGTYQSAIAASNTTYTSGLVVFTGSNMITVKSSGAGQTVILDATQTNQSAIKAFGLSNTGNTAGNTGVSTGVDWVLGGTNNITLSQSTAVGGPNTIWISAPNAGGAGQFSAGVSTGGNTAGATGITGTRLVYVGSNMVSLSQTTDANGGTVTFNATQTNQSAIRGLGVSNTGNTAGNTRLTTGQDFIFAGTGAITASQSSGAATDTIWISAPQTSSLVGTGLVSISTNASTISIGVPYLADQVFENFPMAQANLLTHISAISKTPFYWNERLYGSLNPKTIALRMSNVSTATLQSFAIHFGVYSMVNSTSMALLGSASDSYNVSTGSSASFSGQRNFILTSPGTVAGLSSLTPGDYYFGLMFSAGATGSMHQSLYGASDAAFGPLGGIYPGNNQLSTGTSQGVNPLVGRGSTTVNALPANVVASELVNQGSGASGQLRPWILIRS